jgi:hypothetical protein
MASDHADETRELRERILGMTDANRLMQQQLVDAQVRCVPIIEPLKPILWVLGTEEHPSSWTLIRKPVNPHDALQVGPRDR